MQMLPSLMSGSDEGVVSPLARLSKKARGELQELEELEGAISEADEGRYVKTKCLQLV